ncbi:MAG: hypothetical protein HQL35_15215 [Alphaproteobacteria bacterium]|nr:hypothetical protein [Alphaproteobacteria bacterium]
MPTGRATRFRYNSVMSDDTDDTALPGEDDLLLRPPRKMTLLRSRTAAERAQRTLRQSGGSLPGLNPESAPDPEPDAEAVSEPAAPESAPEPTDAPAAVETDTAEADKKDAKKGKRKEKKKKDKKSKPKNAKKTKKSKKTKGK